MPESTTTGQRFTQLIQHLGLSKNAFAQSLDRTATVIQHLVDERNKPGFDLLHKVFEVYPNVSKDWLMMGTGPMLLEPGAGDPLAAKPAAIADDPIDLASIPGVPRRRSGSSSAHLQPAEVAATVALAAQAQATQLPAPALSEKVPIPTPVPVPTAAPLAAPPVLASPTATAPDPAYLAALLQSQHIQHQLALAEQRNQHLLEQQQLLQQMVQILQKAV